ERGWNNLNITRRGLQDLLAQGDWYDLRIPESEMAFDSFERVFVWQEIAVALLKKYCERFYTFRKRDWEEPHLEYQLLSPDDPNFVGYSEDDEEHFYRILVDQSRSDVVGDVERLREAILAGNMAPANFRSVTALWFEQHLYEPLLHVKPGSAITIRPVHLNAGEYQFVHDLKAVCEGADNDVLSETELYLLRNRSRGGGVGFFEAGNFHPDFMLWLVRPDHQVLVFVDPKGLLNIGPEDPKIRFYKTVKEIEDRIADPQMSLEAFIVSTTPYVNVRNRWGHGKKWMAERNILFPDDDPSYIKTMIQRAMEGVAS
ncbi:MAG: DEAD/DEAH box helicase, partial [Planctomycetota bacterium]